MIMLIKYRFFKKIRYVSIVEVIDRHDAYDASMLLKSDS